MRIWERMSVAVMQVDWMLVNLRERRRVSGGRTHFQLKRKISKDYR